MSYEEPAEYACCECPHADLMRRFFHYLALARKVGIHSVIDMLAVEPLSPMNTASIAMLRAWDAGGDWQFESYIDKEAYA